jgi:SAM-dependent methyltransferase
MDAEYPARPTAGGYPVERVDRIAAAQAGHFWFESRNRLLIWAFRRFFPGAGDFLEIGCGSGFVLQAFRRAFPSLRLTGTDYLQPALDIAVARVADARFIRGEAQHVAPPVPVDVVGAFDVLEHIEDDLAALQRMVAIVRPGGGVMITVPQHRWLWSATDERACHVRRYRRGELVERVTAAGLRVEYVTSFVSLLLPLMAASRWRARSVAGESELQVSAHVNGILTAIQSVERRLIESGVRFPAGGSLLLVARKP